MKNFVMAMLVVGLMAVGTQAGVVLVITPEASPAPGLSAYTVSAVGTEALNVGSIASLHLYGAHQVWQTQNFGHNPSPLETSLVAPFADPVTWPPLDSHLLLVPGDNILSPGFGTDETNDGNDPAGLGPLAMPGFEAYPAVVGCGDTFFTGSAAQITLVPFASPVDFLYVVAAEGCGVPLLDVTFIDSSSQGFIELFDVPIIPEPTTLLVLVGGALAGLIRRR